MHPRSVVFTVLVMSSIHAQPTFHCNEEQEQSCSQIQASRERDTIVQSLERSVANIISRLNSVELAVRNTENCGALDRMTRRYEDNFYMLGLHNLTWAQARERCYQCGYGLARIESDDEQEFIRTWLNDIEAGTFAQWIWIDGTDQGHEGCWVWTHPEVTSFSSGFTAWKPTQPDNFGGIEHCNHLSKGTWLWNDRPCIEKKLFLCEKQENGSISDLVSLDAIQTASVCSK